MSIEIMKQWREALVCALSDDKPYIDRCKQAIASIDQAIADAEKQEPVAWLHKETALLRKETNKLKGADWDSSHWTPLYTHPQPKREWVGLTDEDDIDWDITKNLKQLVEAVEAKLKEKNT